MNENTPAIRSKLHSAIEAVDKQLAELKEVKDRTVKTDGIFRWNPLYTANSGIDIHRCRDIGELINIHQYIRTKHESYAQSAKELGLDSYPVFKWMNYTWEAWEHDLKIRVTLVSHKVQHEKLLKAKAKLNRFLTDEDQLAMTLKELGF